MIDTDFAIRRIAESGIQEAQARSIVREIVDAQVELVSKRDLTEALREFKADIKSDIADIKHDIALNNKLANLKFTGLYAMLFALCVGMVKLLFWGLS